MTTSPLYHNEQQLDWNAVAAKANDLKQAIKDQHAQAWDLIDGFSAHAPWTVFETLQTNAPPKVSLFNAFSLTDGSDEIMLNEAALERCCANGYNFLKDTEFIFSQWNLPENDNPSFLRTIDTLQRLANEYHLQGINGEQILHFATGYLWTPDMVAACCHSHIINAQDNRGDTPLNTLWDDMIHGTYERRHIELSWLLIGHGADPMLANARGVRPLDLMTTVVREETYSEDGGDGPLRKLIAHIHAQEDRKVLRAHVAGQGRAIRTSKM